MSLKTYLENIVSYPLAAKFIITQMGNVLYLGYNELPDSSNGTKRDIEKYAEEFFSLEDEEDIEDFVEWVEEGMSVGGKKILSKQLVDEILSEVEMSITTPMTVYRTGEAHSTWVSFSKVSGNYNHQGTEEKYILPIGTKIVDCLDYADRNEILINKNEIKRGNENE